MLGVRNPAFLGGIGLYATGGTVSEITVGSDNYRVHQFTPTGTSTLTVHGSGPVEYLIIAGGGGGGQPGFCGGGGGAGGYRTSVPGQISGRNSVAESPVFITTGSYPVVVGAGGSVNQNGVNSSFAGIVSIGGGYGNAASGGSGGGRNSQGGGGGAGTAGQGFNGGSGDYDGINPASDQAGGGGGAGSVGTNGKAGEFDGQTPLVNPIPGYGGSGLSSNITGTSVTRAQGGNGGGAAQNGAVGPANSGKGGGGQSSFPPSVGGAGGSGIVIIRYKVA
jgi:hypothetical protein